MHYYRMLLIGAVMSMTAHAAEPKLLPAELVQAREQQQQLAQQILTSFPTIDSVAKLMQLAQQDSPLDAFPPAQKQQFIASVQFRQQQLSDFDMELLTRELTPTEIYQVLLLLGAVEYTQFCSQLARVQTPLDIYLLTYGAEK